MFGRGMLLEKSLETFVSLSKGALWSVFGLSNGILDIGPRVIDLRIIRNGRREPAAVQDSFAQNRTSETQIGMANETCCWTQRTSVMSLSEEKQSAYLHFQIELDVFEVGGWWTPSPVQCLGGFQCHTSAVLRYLAKERFRYMALGSYWTHRPRWSPTPPFHLYLW